MVDYDYFDGAFSGFEFQAELLLASNWENPGLLYFGVWGAGAPLALDGACIWRIVRRPLQSEFVFSGESSFVHNDWA